MSCNGSLQLVFWFSFYRAKHFLWLQPENGLWCQRKSLKCFCSHNSRREVRREQTPFVEHNKGLAKLPTLVVIPGHALSKNTKKIHQKKKNTWFFSVVCWWDLWRTLSPNRGHQGNLVGKEIPTQKNVDIAGLLAISCSQYQEKLSLFL